MVMNGSTMKDDRLHFCSMQLPPISTSDAFLQKTTHSPKLKAADSVSHYFSEVMRLNQTADSQQLAMTNL